MDRVAFIEIGTGVDLHGQDVTTACVRAVKNAIGYNSMPGIRSFLPDGDLNEMRVQVTLGVPYHLDQVDVAAVKAELPYGQIAVVVVLGGLLASSGVVLPDKGDITDEMIIVNAVVTVGY